jgi:hypothetical protein
MQKLADEAMAEQEAAQQREADRVRRRRPGLVSSKG